MTWCATHRAAEQRAAGQDAGHRRRRPDRQPPDRAVRAVRDEVLAHDPYSPRRSRGAGREEGGARRAARARRLRAPQLSADARDRGPMGAAQPAHEADRSSSPPPADPCTTRARSTTPTSGAIAGAGIDVFHTDRPIRRTRCSRSTTSSPAPTPRASPSRRRATSRPPLPSSGSPSSRARCRRASSTPAWPEYADRFAERSAPSRRGAQSVNTRQQETAPRRVAKVRAQLDHPVVDADGHWVELFPVYFDYIAEVGAGRRRQVPHRYGHRFHGWYESTHRGAPATAPPAAVLLGRAGQRARPSRHRDPGPVLRQPRRLGHRRRQCSRA